MLEQDFNKQVIDALCQVVSESGISRAEIARRSGLSRAFITNTLKSQRNMTLKTILRIASAANAVPVVTFQKSSADSSAEVQS